MDFRLWQITLISDGLGNHERGVVLAPYNQRGRLMLPQPSPPSRIAGHVRPVIVEQVDLDVVFARTAQESKLISPAVGINRLGIRVRADMTLPGRSQGGKVSSKTSFVGGPVGPELPPLLPKRTESLLVGNRVLNDERPHSLRMRDSHPKSDRPPIILHVQHVVLKTERLGKTLHYLRNVIKGIGKLLAAGRIAVTETRIIGGNEVVLRGQTGQQWLEHPRR